MYKAAKEDLLFPENQEDILVKFKLSIEDEIIDYEVPVTYKRNDPVDGEVHRSFEVEPEVSVNLQEKVIVFANDEPIKFSPAKIKARANSP